MQLSGDIVRRWLASAEADPTALLGLTLEHLDEDRGGRITEVTGSAITITDAGKAFRAPVASLGRWVVQDVPRGLARRIMSALPIPPAHMEELQRLGFDAAALSVADAALLLAVDEALGGGGEAPFDGIERLAMLAAVTAQAVASIALLRRCLDHPFLASAQARLQLARLASQAGNLNEVLRLTDVALTRNADPRIVPAVRAMLLTVRSSCIAQLAQRCADLLEAKRIAGMALSINGQSEHLSNTYFLIQRRAASLGCTMIPSGA
jgi:hypothetical protein